MRSAGHQILNDELHDGVSQRDGGRLLDGQRSVGNALAMGGTSPPSQDTPMGEGSVFQSTRGASMGILMC